MAVSYVALKKLSKAQASLYSFATKQRSFKLISGKWLTIDRIVNYVQSFADKFQLHRHRTLTSLSQYFIIYILFKCIVKQYVWNKCFNLILYVDFDLCLYRIYVILGYFNKLYPGMLLVRECYKEMVSGCESTSNCKINIYLGSNRYLNYNHNCYEHEGCSNRA